MAPSPKRPRSDVQSYMPQCHKSSAMSNVTRWDISNNDGLDFSDCQGSSRSFHSRETADEILSRSFQQCMPFSGPRAPSLSPFTIPDFNKSDPSYPSICDSHDYTASSSSEKGQRTGSEGYLMPTGQYPLMAEDQSWKQNLGYYGQHQRCEELHQHSSQPIQSGSYPTNFEDAYHPQRYSSNHAPSSYHDKNRMPSMASPGRSSYLPSMMPVAQPSIVVEEAQDDPVYGQRNDHSSLYQDFSGTGVSSASRRGASVGLNAQRSSTPTPSRNHRTSNLEESAEGKLSVPRAPRRGQREDESQRRRRHLTPEGREHAKEVRKAHACKECRRRKIKVCLVWSSGFALLLIFPKS